MKRLLILAFMLMIVCGSVFSVDFGLVLGQTAEAESDFFTSETGFNPWFSYDNGNSISLYLSAFLTMRYSGEFSGEGSMVFIPEFSRFAFIYKINEKISLEAGRIEFADVLGFTASGLFDGIRFKMELPPGSLSAAFLYTGLLYKETASIIMTGTDGINYYTPFEGSNYGDYGASRRALASGRWDMPVKFPAGDACVLSADVLMQIDVNNNDDFLHSQYAAALMEFYPKDMIRITGGLLFSAMQNDSGNFGTAFGFLAQCKMGFPFTKASDLFGVTAKATFGTTENGFTSYMPVSGIPQGSVFEETLSGLAYLSLDYNIRIINSLFAECAVRYFMRTYNMEDEGNLYGGEIWASLGWRLLEDIFIFLGGGLFIPGMGNVYPEETDVIWKVTAGFTLSF